MREEHFEFPSERPVSNLSTSRRYPRARVAYGRDDQLDSVDYQLRLVLVDVVPALHGDDQASVGDEPGEILLQRQHDPFQLVTRPAWKRVAERDAMGQHDQRHRVQGRILARLAYLA